MEHDPMEIYLGVRDLIEEVLGVSGVDVREVLGAGITNQRETTVVFNRDTGFPIYRAIVWQCRRTSGICEDLKARGLEEYIRDNTGLVIDPYFSGTKVSWILDNVSGARALADEGKLGFATIDSWLLYKLSGDRVHLTDYTNASRTMLFNIRTLRWDDKLLDVLNVPSSMLPDVRESSGDFGFIDILGERVSVLAMVGDQQAALFGQNSLGVGDLKVTYGTGAFLLVNTGEEFISSDGGLLTTIGTSYGGKVSYAIEGSVFIAGALMKWLKEGVNLFSSYEEIDELGRSVSDNLGVVVVPAFSGLGAPYWNSEARGVIFGLSRGTTRAHIVRSGLESVALQVFDLIDSLDTDIGRIKVDGGLSESRLLLEIQSGLLKADVIKSSITEASVFGAFALASLALGKSVDEIFGSRENGELISYRFDGKVRDDLIKTWKKSIKALLSWTNDN